MIDQFEVVCSMPWPLNRGEGGGELDITNLLAFHVQIVLERFSYDLEMKTHEQNTSIKRTEIKQFDWFIERIQMRMRRLLVG